MEDNPKREQEIFLQAQECVGREELDSFLERACAGDAPLRQRVEDLLRIHQEAGDFLAGDGSLSPFGVVPRASAPSPCPVGPGQCIGRYKLLQKIGEGGFGEVYMAEQREPVRRKVALKIIKLGMDTKQVIGRFEAERQALALMEHPNIARVLDGGSTESGRPYFVMELVRGVPITHFCNENKISTEDRLRLMMQVCQAIQHAHQKGIIHRDIKPSNVLVTRHDHQAVPKVIDFGVAKALQQDLTDKTIFTRFQEFVGTPAYMSPEQAQMNGLDIDTRSDIYSLGVLLYELLTGHTPFDGQQLLQAGYDEMRRHLREVEPLKPSTRLNTLSLEDQTSVARRHNTSRERLRHLLHGDLDWVVMKAMEKDRARRYDSASDLAKDLERYLDNQPVMAAAPSALYRLQKFAQRHRAGVVTTILLIALLIAGTIVSSYFAIRATRAERRARQEAAIAEAVNRFLNEDLFAQANPQNQPDRELTVRALLDRAAPQIQARFAGRPLVEATIHTTLGQIYHKLGETEPADQHLRRALELRTQVLGEAHPEAIAALSDLAMNRLLMKKHAEASQQGVRAVELARDRLGDRNPLTFRYLSRLAWIYFMAADADRALATAHQALDQVRWIPAVDPEDHAQALQVMARMLGRQGRVSEGEKMLRDALLLIRGNYGEADPRTASAKNRLAAYLYDHQYKRADAETLYLEALENHRRVYGESHWRTRSLRGNLVLLYRYREPLEPWKAIYHQLHMVMHAPAEQVTDLQRLRDLLAWSPLPSLENLPPDQAPLWRMVSSPPAPNWTDESFQEEGWITTHAPAGSELWLRRDLVLDRAPAHGLIMILPARGDFEIYLNGRQISSQHLRRSDQFQVLLGDQRLAGLLRGGRNLLALHGKRLDQRQVVKLDLVRFPDPSPETP